MWHWTRSFGMSAGIVTACLAGTAMAEVPRVADNDIIQIAATDSGFTKWRQNFRLKALRAGVSSRVFDAAYQGVELNRRVLELDRSQSEFTKTVGEYIALTVPNTRIRAMR